MSINQDPITVIGHTYGTGEAVFLLLPISRPLFDERRITIRPVEEDYPVMSFTVPSDEAFTYTIEDNGRSWEAEVKWEVPDGERNQES